MERLAEDNYVQIAENAIKELVAPARRDKNGNPVGIVELPQGISEICWL